MNILEKLKMMGIAPTFPQDLAQNSGNLGATTTGGGDIPIPQTAPQDEFYTDNTAGLGYDAQGNQKQTTLNLAPQMPQTVDTNLAPTDAPVANLNLAPIAENERPIRAEQNAPVTSEGVSDTYAPLSDRTFVPNQAKTGFDSVSNYTNLNLPQPQMPNTADETAMVTDVPQNRNLALAPQTTQDKINAITGKNYDKEIKDPITGEIIQERGKDRDKKWSTWEKIGNGALGALMGLGQGGIGGAIVGGVKGATDRNFNEKLDDQRQLGKLYPQQERENKQREFDTNQQYKQAQIEIAKQKPVLARTAEERRQQELKLRQSRQEFQQLNADQKTTLNAIMKRGYYKEGMNAEEDKRIAALGIVLPDFDSRPKKYVEQNGTYFEIRPDGSQVKLDGIPTDESEIPVQYSVGGKTLMMRPRDIANIEAANVRQDKQIQTTVSENEKDRDLRVQLQKDSQQNGVEQTRAKAVEGFKKAFFTKNGRNPSQEEVDNYAQNVVNPILAQDMGVTAEGTVK